MSAGIGEHLCIWKSELRLFNTDSFKEGAAFVDHRVAPIIN